MNVRWKCIPLVLALSGCDLQTAEGDYFPITTIWDAKCGFHVELGQLDTISSHGYVVQIFKDAKPRAGIVKETNAVINIAGMLDDDIKLYSKDGCYVLEAHFGYGGLVRPVWRDPDTGKSICFDVVPERGPKPYR